MKQIHDPVRDFLDGYWEAQKESARLERRIEQLDAQSRNITSRLSGMPRGGGSGGITAIWDALADARTRAEENLRATLQRERDIEEFISRIEAPKLRTLLRLRYLELRPWLDIARELEHERRYTMRLHGQALAAARTLWAETHPEDYQHCESKEEGGNASE